MAAIDYDTLFNRLGAIGHVAYVLAGDQAAVPATITSLIALYENTSDVDLAGSLITTQTTIINPVVSIANTIAGLASSTLVRMVQASQPSITAVPNALVELIRQMRLDSQSVKTCTVSASSVALTTNIGDGVVVTSTKRGDGLVQENIIAEVLRLSCVNDSYTGSATAGQEQFQLAGQPNNTPLWNYDFPQGSAATQSVNAISTDQNSTVGGNLLNNSNFENWSGALSTDSLDNWVLGVGTYGTDVEQSTTAYGGLLSLRFLPTATNTAIYQEFNNGTGTNVSLGSLLSFPVNMWIRALAATVSAGVLTVELVDDTNTVINDEQGTPNSFTRTLSTLTTDWVPFNGTFRVPEAPPAVMRIQLRISTAIVGSSVLIDSMAMGAMTASYPGGFGFAVFSGTTPFQNGDAFNTTTANNRGGQLYLGNFQALFARFYATPTIGSVGLLLPSSGSPTQPDSKIVS